MWTHDQLSVSTRQCRLDWAGEAREGSLAAHGVRDQHLSDTHEQRDEVSAHMSERTTVLAAAAAAAVAEPDGVPPVALALAAICLAANTYACSSFHMFFAATATKEKLARNSLSVGARTARTSELGNASVASLSRSFHTTQR